jgi:hypothetical protein
MLEYAAEFGLQFDEEIIVGCAESGDVDKCRAVTSEQADLSGFVTLAAATSGSVATLKFFAEEMGVRTMTLSMHQAAARGDLPIVEYLYHLHADSDDADWTEGMIEAAVEGGGQLEVLRFGLANKCWISETAVQSAARYADLPVLELLLTHRTPTQNEAGEDEELEDVPRLLDICANREDMAAFELVLSHGYEITSEVCEAAARSSSSEILQHLIDTQQTLLHQPAVAEWAVRCDCVDNLRLLRSVPNFPWDSFGLARMACWNCSPKVLTYLRDEQQLQTLSAEQLTELLMCCGGSDTPACAEIMRECGAQWGTTLQYTAEPDDDSDESDEDDDENDGNEGEIRTWKSGMAQWAVEHGYTGPLPPPPSTSDDEVDSGNDDEGPDMHGMDAEQFSFMQAFAAATHDWPDE